MSNSEPMLRGSHGASEIVMLWISFNIRLLWVVLEGLAWLYYVIYCENLAGQQVFWTSKSLNAINHRVAVDESLWILFKYFFKYYIIVDFYMYLVHPLQERRGDTCFVLPSFMYFS